MTDYPALWRILINKAAQRQYARTDRNSNVMALSCQSSLCQHEPLFRIGVILLSSMVDPGILTSTRITATPYRGRMGVARLALRSQVQTANVMEVSRSRYISLASLVSVPSFDESAVLRATGAMLSASKLFSFSYIFSVSSNEFIVR